MLITIGILAHNEAERIGATLESLFRQSVFSRSEGASAPSHRWQIVVVPNGCTDDTAQRAQDALRTSVDAISGKAVSFAVESLDRPGKSNAWNELVHRIAAAETDLFVMMDADIEFGHPDTLANSVKRLLDDPSALVVVDRPLKDFTRKPKLTLMERLSVLAFKTNEHDHPGIAGSFYCARAATLRHIWMPIGLSVEDGFLAAMVTSDFFRSAPDPGRIVRASDATHYFEGISDIRAVVLHEVRLVIGTLLNCYLCWDALLFITPSNGNGAGFTIRDLNESKPDWYARMMANQIAARGRWVIPRGMVLRRWISWRRLAWPQRLSRIPLTMTAFAFDLIVFYIANRRLVSGRSVGYW